MILTPPKNSPRAEVITGKQHAGIIGNEGGFILAFAMFMLAVCMLLGTAAMNTSVNETAISANEVVVKQTYVLANSGYPLAAVPILSTAGVGQWDTGSISSPITVYLDDTNPLQTATSGAIQIIHGEFLYEGKDADITYNTGWNNADKCLCAPDSAHATAYTPNDDPFQRRKADGTLYKPAIDNRPDIRIRHAGLIIDVDVDKAAVGYLAGGVAEFGSGAEGSTGASYKLSYLLDCKATVPGKDIANSSSPATEIALGYRYVPDAGI